MSTQKTPDLRQLRRSYSRAIAASQRAAERHADYSRHDMSVGALFEATKDEAEANRLEIEAGRAFLAALDEQDPACSVCGCTELDPCIHGGVACSWAHKPGEPPLCDFCTQLAGLP